MPCEIVYKADSSECEIFVSFEDVAHVCQLVFDFHCFAVKFVDFSGFLDYETLLASAMAELDDCGGHFGLSFLVVGNYIIHHC
jgi:hypothetical protein